MAVLIWWLTGIGFLEDTAWWALTVVIPAMALLARDRYAGLGHSLIPGWLIMRSGSLNRKHTALAVDGVIGFTVRSSYFQRRAHLVTLIATTAAGAQKYVVPDLSSEAAWDLVEAVLVEPSSGAHAPSTSGSGS